MQFQLEIQKIARFCLFKLTWGKGQQISATLAYPNTLSELYQTWRQAYLNFYQTALRARVPKLNNPDGKISLPQDWHRQLVQSEAQLLSEFHRWLRREELYEIRAKIASERKNTVHQAPISLFLICSGELERLPWETWELGAEFNYSVAIARSPVNITNPSKNPPKRRRKPRILAILGDDTGLDLQGDRESLNALKQVAEIELVTWQPQQPAAEIKQQIQQVLTDASGWEVLFFAGHSNETAITGGELAIAPNIALSVREIAPQLEIAKANGLQFALFNSCSGLSIANSLIDLGLSQVAVMREPIHNQVAQVFLIQFLQALGEYKNVQEALSSAGEYLKQKQNLTYPSAYLIPSLFCHPHAQLFQIEPWGWQHQLQKWMPTKKEAIAQEENSQSSTATAQNVQKTPGDSESIDKKDNDRNIEPASETRRQEKSSIFETIWKLLRAKREQEPALSSRSNICEITPGLLGETNIIYSDRPLFLWQGKVPNLEIYLYSPFSLDREQEVYWTSDVIPDSRQVMYTGKALQPGQIYDWELVADSQTNRRRISFQVMEAAKRDRLSAELTVLETQLTTQGATTEEIALEKANYFAEKDLWSDAIQQIYSIENSSTVLSSNTQEIANYLCESNNADSNLSQEK